MDWGHQPKEMQYTMGNPRMVVVAFRTSKSCDKSGGMQAGNDCAGSLSLESYQGLDLWKKPVYSNHGTAILVASVLIKSALRLILYANLLFALDVSVKATECLLTYNPYLLLLNLDLINRLMAIGYFHWV